MTSLLRTLSNLTGSLASKALASGKNAGKTGSGLVGRQVAQNLLKQAYLKVLPSRSVPLRCKVLALGLYQVVQII